MATMTVIWWRDIPAQVTAREGRRQSKIVLHPRFQVAIDKAASRAGKRAYNDYIEEWRRTQKRCGDDIDQRGRRRGRSASRPTTTSTAWRMLIQSGGVEGGPVFSPAHDETQGNGTEDRRMTRTVVSSATREVVIGDDQPFVIIGERINPTGRKVLMEEMKAGDFSRVERDTIAQVEAGAQMLDVNAGIPLADEPAILAETIQLVQSLTDLPLSIDSSIVEALEAGLAVYQGKPLLNSVTGEEERLERVLPLVKKYGCAVVAICNDETGICDGPGRPLRGRRSGSSSAPPTTASRARTSWSTRCSCRSARWPAPAARSSGSSAGCATSSRSTRPAARRTSASGCRTARASTARSSSMAIAVGSDLGDHQPGRRGRPPRGHGQRRADGQRPGRNALDPPVPDRAARGRGRWPSRQPPPWRHRRTATAKRFPPMSRASTSPGSTSRPRALTRPTPVPATARATRATAAGHLHALGATRPRARRHDRARRRALARRRHRLRSAAAAASAGAARSTPGLRVVREARHHVRAGSPRSAGSARGGVSRRNTAWPRTGACPARPPCSAMPSSTSRPRARSTSRSCARTSPRGPSTWIRSCGCTRST